MRHLGKGMIVRISYHEYRRCIKNLDTSPIPAYGQISGFDTIRGVTKYLLTNVIRDDKDHIIVDSKMDYFYLDEIIHTCSDLNEKWKRISTQFQYDKTQILNIIQSMHIECTKKVSEDLDDILQKLYVKLILKYRKEMKELFSKKED